jgi:hypothetical protein
MADLLGSDFRLAEPHRLYARHDFLLTHKADLFSHLMARWHDLFNVSFDVLLYDLTSTYFEINAVDAPEGDKRRHGYSRDKRPDCPQVVIALVVTPEGLPLAYEVLPGNTADCKTLRMFLDKIEQQYGAALGVGGLWIVAFRPKRSSRTCGRATRRCSTWWEHRKAVSPVWRKACWSNPGSRRARVFSIFLSLSKNRFEDARVSSSVRRRSRRSCQRHGHQVSHTLNPFGCYGSEWPLILAA